MRIEELHLKNFRCFKELDIKFPASNLAVFIGLNGSGKTAILNAIISLLDIEEPDKYFLHNMKDNFCIGSSNTIENEMLVNYENNIIKCKYCFTPDGSGSYGSDLNRIIPSGKFAFIYYTTDRKNIYTMNTHGSDNINFYNFDGWFEQAENFENELKLDNKKLEFSILRLDVVRKAIATFCSSISGANFHNLKVRRIYNNNKITGSYEEEIKKHNSFLVIHKNEKELKLSQLSEGERLILHLVGDIAYKLTKNDKSLDEIDFDDHKDTVNNALKSNGIVLIDEIELHLHPQWQREVLPALQKTFPNIQFIVTTHSPQVLSNVKKENIFILADGKIIENTPHTEGRDVNSILYELFGVEERPLAYKDKINKLYHALDDENISEAKEILAELTELFGEQDTEIVKANLHLRFATEE